jgi:hypothetical protein
VESVELSGVSPTLVDEAPAELAPPMLGVSGTVLALEPGLPEVLGAVRVVVAPAAWPA